MWPVIVAGALLALPRVVRLLYPQIWIEDESYLNTSFMVSRGLLPYRDFPLPHFPLLEAAMAMVFKVAPIAIRTAEAVSAVAGAIASYLILVIGRRIGGTATGVAAAAMFATSGLLFRYHLFEREVFDIVPVLAAMMLVVAGARRDEAPGPTNPRRIRVEPTPIELTLRRPIAIGTLLAVAMGIKLTAFAAAVGIVLQLIAAKRRREALVVAATAAALVIAASVAFAITCGVDFVTQVFVFRAVHASFPSVGVKLNEMRYTLDIAFALGVAGVVLIVWTGRTRRFAGPLLQLASGFAFLVLLNPTYWAHTGIELLPWLAICGGALIAGVAARVTKRAALDWVELDAVAVWVCAGGAALVLVYVSPIKNLNWEAGEGSTYGFGYRDRVEVDNVAAFVRAHTAPHATVATPPIIAFAANRIEVTPYAELAGDTAELTDAVRRDGYWSVLGASPLRTRTFWEGVEASRERIAPFIDESITKRRAAAVINYSADDLFPIPLIDVPQERLEAAGYELATVTAHYEVWIPRPSR